MYITHTKQHCDPLRQREVCFHSAITNDCCWRRGSLGPREPSSFLRMHKATALIHIWDVEFEISQGFAMEMFTLNQHINTIKKNLKTQRSTEM